MLTFPTTPNRHKDKDIHHAHDHSPAPSINSTSSAKSKRTVSMHSPGKLVKKVKSSLRRISDHVTNHKHRSPSESGLAAIVPLTTNPLLAPLGVHAPMEGTASHDHATTPIGQQPEEPGNGTERMRRDGGTSWEEKRDRHVARRTRSLSFISGFFPRTRPSSRAESVSTTVEHSISDSGTLASEELTQGVEEKELSLQLEPTFDPPQYQLVVVEESTAEEERVAEEEMDHDQYGSSLEPPPVTDTSEMMEGSYDLEPPTSPDVITEPEVPDPFLVDDEGDALSEEERNAATAPVETISESHGHSTPAHEISLLPQEASAAVTPAVSPSPVIDKDVPALPSTESEKEEAPELFVPALIAPSMFLPIPNTDPLTILLSKYIYPPEKRPIRDLTGDWQRNDFHTLVMTNSWRALARMARDRLVTANPEDLTLILNLWYIRLSSLSRLRLFNQTSAECTNLFAVLNAIEPPDDRAWLFDNILPFELDVMHARLKYWAGDHMGYLDALYALLHECKIKARQAGRQAAALAASRAKAGATLTASSATDGSAVTATMWKERGVRICLIMASQLMEMNDIAAATKLMEPLCQQPNYAVTADGAQQDAQNTSIPALRSVVGRMYLQAGNLHMAARHFSDVAQDPSADATMKEMNAALFACADGQWERATVILGQLLEKDADNFVAANNNAVALLGQGRVREGIAILENALKASPSSVVVAEPFLFNLATLYELRYAGAIEKKRDLLVEVAKWSGDGLKTSCLKMPTN
ncbi:hypothetical protein APHAL10511_004279 [Amanita phalloides]|nr:hypothetical protein APHAL10511_004279 [Amanita phalloides]